MKKVNMEVIKPWITTKITEILTLEDDVLINYIFGLLEDKVCVVIEATMVTVTRCSLSCTTFITPFAILFIGALLYRMLSHRPYLTSEHYLDP